MRALIVGAGAVGQVYGYHLQQAGWEVGFLVRPKYAEAARSGFTLYPLNKPHRGRPVRFEGLEVYDSAEAAAEQSWDQVWLAVSSEPHGAGRRHGAYGTMGRWCCRQATVFWGDAGGGTPMPRTLEEPWGVPRALGPLPLSFSLQGNPIPPAQSG